MSSTRLPGKVLLTALGEPLLSHQITRVLKAKRVANFVVATTDRDVDSPIVDLCTSRGVSTFRGSETDVLHRFRVASELFETSHCVRITSDCPMIDPAIIDLCIEQYVSSGADYLNNSESFPNGMNVEVFSRELLKRADDESSKAHEREHVTPFFYTQPTLFKIARARSSRIYPNYRLTVDTAEDYEVVKTLIERLLPRKMDYTLDDICQELDLDTQLANLNSNVKQKSYDE